MTETRFVVATATRNEGAFLVEWIAWYRMLGFEIVVATNDCTDRSPGLLDALAREGWLRHVPHSPPRGQPPKLSAHRALKADGAVSTADWLLVCDVDEFLVLHAADTIADLVGPPPWDVLGIALSWKIFGTSGWKHYEPGLVHRQFTRCGVSKLPINRPFKSLFRQVGRFERLGAHTPHGFDGDWRDPAHAWITADGRPLPQFADPARHPIRFLTQGQINHDAAQLNHYVLRSEDHFAAKKGTPSASALNDRYTDDFYERRNKNGVIDRSARRFGKAFDDVHAEAMALPGVARLHHLCCADYVERLCAHQGRDHLTDARWLAAMEQAG